MIKTIFFIDGFNFYHSINSSGYHKYKWIDFSKLVHLFTRPEEKIEDIYFFTALAKWSQSKREKHQLLIRALQSVGVKTVYGKFKTQDVHCPHCHRIFPKFVEKKTDVNIAIHLFQSAFKDKFDKAYLVSGDSDLVPAVSAVKGLFPSKKIEAIFPINRASNELRRTCDYSQKIRKRHLEQCVFPDPVVLRDGTSLSCPANWV